MVENQMIFTENQYGKDLKMKVWAMEASIREIRLICAASIPPILLSIFSGLSCKDPNQIFPLS